jgi:hypothetical protein
MLQQTVLICFRFFSSHAIDNDLGGSCDASIFCSNVRSVEQQLENYTCVINVDISACVLQSGAFGTLSKNICENATFSFSMCVRE